MQFSFTVVHFQIDLCIFLSELCIVSATFTFAIWEQSFLCSVFLCKKQSLFIYLRCVKYLPLLRHKKYFALCIVRSIAIFPADIMVCHLIIVLTIFAGLPTATEFSGTFFVTTLPAPITELSPILTPGRIILPEPIQTFLPIQTADGIRH